MDKHLGSCHCGAIKFSFNYREITSGVRCNCSICKRKGAVMSKFTLSPVEIDIDVINDALGTYQFGTNIAKHHFCKVCGIYPFHQTMSKPGEYRVNLGCIDILDTNTLKIDLFDGKDL